MDVAVMVGSLAAACSVASFAPQAWKIIRTRDTNSLSTGMYVLTVCGFGLWLAYGVMLGQWPLIVTNGACLSMASFILAMKLASPRQRAKVAEALSPASGLRGATVEGGSAEGGEDLLVLVVLHELGQARHFLHAQALREAAFGIGHDGGVGGGTDLLPGAGGLAQLELRDRHLEDDARDRLLRGRGLDEARGGRRSRGTRSPSPRR